MTLPMPTSKRCSIKSTEDQGKNSTLTRLNVVSSETALVPDLYVDLDKEQEGKFQRMIDALEDLDDVQEVYHNVNLSEDEE